MSISSFSQSKKELQAEVSRLNQQLAQANTEIEQLKKPKEADLSNEHKKASYALGVLMTSNLKMQGTDSLDLESLTIAIRDVIQGNELIIGEDEAMAIVQPYMARVMEQKMNAAKAEGVAFLEGNKTKEGVNVTDSGLQYKVIKSGSGQMPTADNEVTVHYTGKLVDGTVFDSSVQRGEPATFGVGQVIAGWTEALQLMHVGDKWELYIPSGLAYGERGAGGRIPPHSVLIFEVELLEVK